MVEEHGPSQRKRPLHARDHASAAFWELESPGSETVHPTQVGSYRVLGLIGTGGMGIVYRAEQENPRRVIALKMIRADVTSPTMLRRFRDEAQLLGRLHHPGIAQVHEAGAAEGDQGPQPFIAMEFVDGKVITSHARNRGLGTRERLALMAEVCDAVHHAHQKGVIHRDLKPGNILVDQSGQSKIVDFGVARLTDSDLRVTTMHTGVGQLIGTLPYMSPEQILADPTKLDTRSDVYALGVVLYELLAERLPYDLHNKSVPEAARVIGEEEPTPLSSVNRVLRGDIETIVNKALEKDKSRRYESASELGDDIRRYLRNEPIAARPASSWYQFRKFSRRHRALVVGTASVFAVLLLGITGTSIALVRASRAERLAAMRQQDAERNAKIAAAVNEFLNRDLLSSVSPDQSGRDTTVKEVLDRASESIEGRFREAPLVEAAIRMTLGTTYHKLGEYEEAEPHLQRAVELRMGQSGIAASDLLESQLASAELMVDAGELDDAQSLLHDVNASLGKLPDDRYLSARTQVINGALRTAQGRFDEAERLISEGVEALQTQLGNDHRDVLAARTTLGQAKTMRGRYQDSKAEYEDILSIQRRTLGGAHPDTLMTTNLLAGLYLRMEKNTEALQLLEETLEATVKELGESHPDSISVLGNLGAAHKMLGHYDEAEPKYLRVIELSQRHLPPGHPQQTVALNNLARLYDAQKRYDEAEPVYLDALARRRETLGIDHPDTCGIEENLAGMYIKIGRVEEARELIEHVLAARIAQLGENHRETIFSMYQLGTLLFRLERFEEAAERFSAAVSHAKATLPEKSPWIGKYMASHAHVLLKLGRLDDAERELRNAHELLVASVGPGDPLTVRVTKQLVELLETTDREDEADSLRRQYLDDAAE